MKRVIHIETNLDTVSDLDKLMKLLVPDILAGSKHLRGKRVEFVEAIFNNFMLGILCEYYVGLHSLDEFEDDMHDLVSILCQRIRDKRKEMSR